MEIVLTINLLASFLLIVYIVNKTSRDKIETIRELSKAMLSKNLEDYVSVIPEENEVEEEIVDELEELSETNEGVLLKHLKQKYEDI